MDENVGFSFDYHINRRQEIIVHLLLAEVHPALGIEAVEGGKAKVGVSAMWTRCILIFYLDVDGI